MFIKELMISFYWRHFATVFSMKSSSNNDFDLYDVNKIQYIIYEMWFVIFFRYWYLSKAGHVHWNCHLCQYPSTCLAE